MSWRFLNAAARGTSHERAATPCQDDCFVDVVEDVLVAIAADGAGSAARSAEGAGLVCERFVRVVEQWVRDGGAIDAVTRELVESWIAETRAVVQSRADETELTPRDFACTIVAAVVGPAAAAFVQIGDGAIVAGADDAREVIFWPDGGEYANMTYFATDEDWATHLRFELRTPACDEVALMTDGLQRLALQFESRSAHEPFFQPMFAALRAAPPGPAATLEPALVAFLESDSVNARTDDDKSLVLATRRPGAADAAG